MNYSFHPEAEREFVEAIDYFEELEIGLGYDFAVEVYLENAFDACRSTSTFHYIMWVNRMLTWTTT